MFFTTGILAAAALSASVSWFLYRSNKSIVTTTIDFESEKLPSTFDGFRIVQVSDLQNQYFGRDQKNLAEKVAAARPGIIVITGDLTDRNRRQDEAAFAAAGALTTIAPVYYTSGNHELALDEETQAAIYRRLSALGVHVLLDDREAIYRGKKALRIMGLSERTVFLAKEEFAENSRGKVGLAFPQRITDAVDRLAANRSDEEFSVLLVHEPQFGKLYGRPGVDLILCGHAHGGQIRLPLTEGLFAPGQGLFPKLTAGEHDFGPSKMIISRGLGNSVFPLRLFNRPEIVAVNLHRVGGQRAREK